jgi:hypothetical protein
MTKILLSKKFFVSLFLVFFTTVVVVYGDPDGRTGRTLKTSTAGCGSCHGSSATTGVTTTIAGPDSVTKGTTAQFTLTITYAGKTGAGLDIATRQGTLAPVSNNIHLANGELTQNSNITMSGGSVTVTFNYTAPNAAGTDTIWATGLATNSNGGQSGDNWNWAPSKRIIIKNLTAIEPISTVANEFSLGQNYPNPFNPSTKFEVSIANEGFTSIKLYNTLGEELYVFSNEILKKGKYEFTWNGVNMNGKSVNSGVYFIKMISGEYIMTRKITLIK